MTFYDYLQKTLAGPAIDTGLYYSGFTKMEVVFKILETPATSSSPFGMVGSITSGGSVAYILGMQSSGKWAFRVGGSSNQVILDDEPVVGHKYDMIMTTSGSSAEISVDGVSQGTFTPGSVTTARKCWLMDFNPGVAARLVKLRMYRCKMWNGETLIRDFVPCVNDLDEPGMYDLVNEVFHGNIGTEAFTVGDDVYTVSFDPNGGMGTMTPQTIHTDTPTALKLNTYTRDDYLFLGWSTTPDGIVQYTNGETVTNLAAPEGSITLYAVWQYVTPTYTIAYSSNGGQGAMAPTVAEINETVSLRLCTFSRVGYTFLGWAGAPGGMVQYTDGQTVTNLAPRDTTIVLYAVWGSVAGFDVVLQTNQSEINKVDKTIRDIATFTGTLRDTTSIIDPVILIECDLGDLIGCNYCTIAIFGRSYFVTNITSVRDGLVEIRCRVDVLSSFAKEIKSNTGVVRRSQSKELYNLYLNDGSLMSYQDPYILTEPFPYGFGGWGFILAVAGD